MGLDASRFCLTVSLSSHSFISIVKNKNFHIDIKIFLMPQFMNYSIRMIIDKLSESNRGLSDNNKYWLPNDNHGNTLYIILQHLYIKILSLSCQVQPYHLYYFSNKANKTKMVQVSDDQEKRAIRKKFQLRKPRWEKLN